MRALNLTRQTVLVEHGEVAATSWTRLKGLLGHPPLQSGEGLLIRPSYGIHMLGMRFPIDALYLDETGRVVRAVERLSPGRLGPFAFETYCVLELPAGTIAASGTALGDRIEIEE